MKIEHITLGGNAVIRDTDSISDAVKNKLSGITGKTQKLWIPDIPFGIVITVNEEGAIFNLQKGEVPFTVNVCCFEEKYKSTMLANVDQLNFFKFDTIDPVTPNWLYTCIFMPILDPYEASLAGEIELYIYHQLLLKK
jgi:hypothetical protein